MQSKFFIVLFTIITYQLTAAFQIEFIPKNSFDAAKLKQVMSLLWQADAAETDAADSKPIWHILGPIAAIKKLQKLRADKKLPEEEAPWEKLFAAWFDPEAIKLLREVDGDVLSATCFVDHFMQGTIPLPVPNKRISQPAHGGILGWERFVMFVHDMLHSQNMARNIMKYQSALKPMFETLRSKCPTDKKDTLNWVLAMYIHELEHHHNIFADAKSDGEIFAAICSHLKKKFGEEMNHQNYEDPTQLPRFAQELAFADAMYQAAVQSCINTDELTFAGFIQNLQDLVKLPAIARYMVTEKTGTDNGDTVDVIVALNGQKYLCQTLSRLGARKLMYGDVIRDLIDIKALESDAAIESIIREQLVVKWNEVIDSIQASFATCFSDSTLSHWSTQLTQIVHGKDRDGDHPLIPVEGCARDFRRDEYEEHNHNRHGHDGPQHLKQSASITTSSAPQQHARSASYPVEMFERMQETRRPAPEKLQSMHKFVAKTSVMNSDAAQATAAITASTYGWARMPLLIGATLLKSQTFDNDNSYAEALFTKCKEFGLQISRKIDTSLNLTCEFDAESIEPDNLETIYFKRALTELYDRTIDDSMLNGIIREIADTEIRQSHSNATDKTSFQWILETIK